MIDKLEVEFSLDINHKGIENRKYTLTHSDETGQRFLFVRDQFAEEEYDELRDEVIADWYKKEDNKELRIMCILYAEKSLYTEEERYKIFKRHMPRAITAIIGGDEEYITKNNLLDYDVYAYYLSDLIPKKEYYGKVGEYIEITANA